MMTLAVLHNGPLAVLLRRTVAADLPELVALLVGDPLGASRRPLAAQTPSLPTARRFTGLMTTLRTRC